MNGTKFLYHALGAWGVYIILSGSWTIFQILFIFFHGGFNGTLLGRLVLESFFIALAWPFMIKPSLDNIKALKEQEQAG